MKRFPSFAIAATALLAAVTLMLRGNSCGHDFDFHLLSWMEVSRSWHAGLAYPRWVQDANYGAGEPRLIFYPPASWMLGGLLGTLFGWHAAPVLFILLSLAIGGAGMYRLAREWASSSAATFAACLYIANPYALFVAYERSALGELLAAAWLPWMVCFALRKQSSVVPLALSIGALWLTNSPAAVVASYLLALLALVMWMVERKPWPALRAAGGMALGLGLAAFYIVPAVVQQRWVQIERAISPGMRVEDSFLFGHTSNAFHDQVLHKASWIFVAEMAAALLAAWLASKQKADGSARLALTACLPVIVLLQFPISMPVWTYAPHMKFLQFPWRWVLALNVILCVLAAMAAKLSRRGLALAAIVMAMLAIGGGWRFYQPCDDEDAVTPQVAAFHAGLGVEGTDEYSPTGADTSKLTPGLPLVRVFGAQGAIAHATLANAEHWSVSLTTPEAGYAVLRLMDYPAWRVTLDGQTVPSRPLRDDGLMAVPVAPGSHVIEVAWQTTRDVTLGRILSLLALLALGGVTLGELRKRPV
jgi:hypothetical protein